MDGTYAYINLLSCLSNRSRNALKLFFSYDLNGNKKDIDELSVQDVVNWLLEQPNNDIYKTGKNDLIKLRGIGEKSYNEIMHYVNYYLKELCVKKSR